MTIPAGFQVLPGQLVQNQADLADTTKVAPLTLSLEEFEVGVFDVNQNFALGYTSLYDISPNSVRGIGFDPSDMVDPTNPGSVVPIIGGVQKPVPGFKDRLDGRLIIANNTVAQLNRIFSNSVAMRGDEGHPISILSFLSVASQSTFHSLNNTSVSVGEFAKIGAHCVVHGGVNQVTGNTVTQIGNSLHWATTRSSIARPSATMSPSARSATSTARLSPRGRSCRMGPSWSRARTRAPSCGE